MRDIRQVIASLRGSSVPTLPRPSYTPTSNEPGCIAMAVPSMKLHMSNEGWQLMEALGCNGYRLCGPGLEIDSIDTSEILSKTNPGLVIVQDKREWDVNHGSLAKSEEHFRGIEDLAFNDSIFKVTILKDSHQCPAYHAESASEIGCHAWIVYYHLDIVKHLAGFPRKEHCIRTFHSIDSNVVPDYSTAREGCVISGALGGVYPLRSFLVQNIKRLPQTTHLKHPGYINTACSTNDYLNTLNKFKVAICTSSVYGYALRKIIEATACGCVVVTDLPTNDILPEIDGNLIRIKANRPLPQLREIQLLLPKLYQTYSSPRQERYSELAKSYYDYRVIGSKLAKDIESLRLNYN